MLVNEFLPMLIILIGASEDRTYPFMVKQSNLLYKVKK